MFFLTVFCFLEVLNFFVKQIKNKENYSRLTILASNSSVVDMMYCRGSTLNNQELRSHVRSEGSKGTANRACNTGRDNKRGQVPNMDDAQTLFSLDDADGCREVKCQRVTRVCAQSVQCHVP